MYPIEQTQFSGAVQFPWLLQTVTLLLVMLLQIGYSQFAPVYPGEQIQAFGAVQLPWPLQTIELLLTTPLQMG